MSSQLVIGERVVYELIFPEERTLMLMLSLHAYLTTPNLPARRQGALCNYTSQEQQYDMKDLHTKDLHHASLILKSVLG